MVVTFRQGIARYQTDVYATPTFLQKSSQSGEFIDLIVSPDPTIVIFAHRNATYVIEESRTVTHAWGPFAVGSGTKYLYWDVNLLDASLTRGFTAIPPIVAGTPPDSPATDQHWYDTTLHQMKVWNGSKWLDKLRVFAATYSSTAIITPMPLGTQAGETGQFEAGNLVLDAYNKPLRQSDGTFVTSSTELSIINAATKPVKFDAEVFSGMADENIPMFSLVQARPNRRIVLARSDDWKSRIIGIVTEDLYSSEIANVITDGLVRYEQWSFSNDQVGRPVFCGRTGEVTLTPPSVGVNQIAGYVYDKDAIYLNVQAVTILDDITDSVPNSTYDPPNAPVADFSVTPMSGVAPLTVQFTSTSIHSPTSVQWDIGNDGTIDSTAETFSYTFSSPGTYSVRLRATNPYGMDEEIKEGIVTVSAAQTELNTNLGVQLSGPLQVAIGQQFNASVILSNDGNQTATNVSRKLTFDDVNGEQVQVSGLPTGSSSARMNGKTIIVLPAVSSLVSGQFATANFTITAPTSAGVINVQADVASRETDSESSDNTTKLMIRVK